MEMINNAVQAIVTGFWRLLALGAERIAALDMWARGRLLALHVAADVQPAILLVIVALLLVLAARLFDGVLRLLLALILVLFAVQVMTPLPGLLR